MPQVIHHSDMLSTKDYNRIKEIFEKIPSFEESLNNITREIRKVNLTKLKEELEH